MSAPVDVLAVMDRDCFAAAQNRDDEGSILPDQRVRMFGESREARAAVAELIEAGSALAAAQVKFDLHGGDPDECSAAWERHAAALARVRGAA